MNTKLGDWEQGTHDLLLENGQLIMESSLGQRIDCALRTFITEHWLNPEVGVRYFEEFLKKNPNPNVCKQALRDVIQGVRGVQTIPYLNVTFENQPRRMRVTFEATGTDSTGQGVTEVAI